MNWSRAVIVGSNGGIGGAMSATLEARGTPTLNLTRADFDLTDEETIANAARRIKPGGPIDFVFVATGILAPDGRRPEKSLRDVAPDAVGQVLAVNTIGPLMVAKHFTPLMPREGRSVFAVLGARVGSITDNRLGGWYAYRASKAALAMIVRTLAIELGRTHPEGLCVALHPGTVATKLSEPFQRNVASAQLFTPEASASHLLKVIDELKPVDSGGHFGWDGMRIEP
ncbi:SDR family NAD(P)-dependent oxidoreductase [Tsuneonella sp. HG094]